MTPARKTITAALAVVTLAGGVSATATPAAAWCNGWTCYSDGPSAGAVAAGVIGGLALGAIAAGAARSHDTCVVRKRIYNRRGRFIGVRRVRVAC